MTKTQKAKIQHYDIDDDGHWIYLNWGLCWQQQGQHLIHEDTRREVLACLSDIHPCNCRECLEALSETESVFC